MDTKRLGALLVFIAAAQCAYAGPVLELSRSKIDWGYVKAGTPNDIQPVFVSNTGDASLAIAAISLQQDYPGTFKVGGTCQAGQTLRPSDRCRLDIDLTLQMATDQPTGALTISSIAGAAIVKLTGVSVLQQFPGYIPPNFVPDYLDFGAQVMGAGTVTQSLVLHNDGTFPWPVRGLALTGANSADFDLTTDCVGQTMSSGSTCNVVIGFHPSAPGPRSTELTLSFHVSAVTVRALTGVGVQAPSASSVAVVEYYNASLDHYFITWHADEIALLDAGTQIKGWVRTGSQFKAYAAAQASSTPVCRYYIPPDKGNSHFFGRGTAECDATGRNNPTFVLEDPAFMHMMLPVAGACPPSTRGIYRVFSNRPDANHRYMTDSAMRDEMTRKGWMAEGDGPEMVVMCSPQ